MEKKKLLRILILKIIGSCVFLCCFTFQVTSQAAAQMQNPESNPELDWAESLAARNREIFIEHLQDNQDDSGREDSGKNLGKNPNKQALKSRPVLQIFVSSSMPKQLLRNYAYEAQRYGGVLVFRGLPDGSFRKLVDLVTDISDAENSAPMQIDDEAFQGFGIETVPAIVLGSPASIFSEQILPEKFDKLSGNITIRAALELFAAQGDLALAAREMLKR